MAKELTEEQARKQIRQAHKKEIRQAQKMPARKGAGICLSVLMGKGIPYS